MSKLDRDFKNEVDTEIREDTYIFRKVAAKLIAFVIAVAAIGGIVGVVYTSTIGKAQKNAEREVFKESVAYTEAAASFLAKEYKEYNDAETSEDKKTIMQYVVMREPNLDTDSIDNDELRRFYNKCLNN